VTIQRQLSLFILDCRSDFVIWMLDEITLGLPAVD